MRVHKMTNLYALTFALGALLLPVEDAAAQRWDWSVTPYVWGETTSLDVYVNDDQVGGAELDFSGLMDKMDFAMQVHVEGRNGKFGVLFDGTYMNTGDKVTFEGRPLIPDGTVLKSDARTMLFDVGGFYRPSGAETGLDILFGARITDISLELDITVPGDPTERAKTSDTMTDGFVGLRYSAPLAEQWFMSLRGDVGAGDSDLAWNAAAIFGYEFGQDKRYAFVFGYRHYVVEFKDTDEGVDIEVDLTMSGPEVGFMFRF